MHSLGWGALLLSTLSAFAQNPEFFEKKVRPVLAKNCQMCHNAKMKSGGLDFVTGAGVAGMGARIAMAVAYEGTIKMPPAGKLAAEEIADIAAWSKSGATWPGTVGPTYATDITEQQKKFWAFQPVKDPAVPQVRDGKWARNAIDRFILAKLEEKGLKPAPPADKLTLLRRATFDLTGLPPTEPEIQAFLADRSPDAFAKVVDRLLASPRYGERWGRHWLDVARYADSTGNDEDHRYPYAWRYRDYVIDAFNRDLPYDRFVREQIAGDLLPGEVPVNRRGLIATGFLALGAKALAQQDKKKMLYDIYDEQVDVVSKAFLGLTVSCARCHNHKFDPILTKDYYSLVSIFASTKDFEDAESHVSKMLYIPLVPKERYDEFLTYKRKLANVQMEIGDVADQEAERRARAVPIAEYMLAARGDRPASGLDARMDAKIVARWAEYLKQEKPHLAEWESATAATAPQVAQAYQARFEKALNDWSEKLEKWRKQARKRLDAMDMPPPPKPKHKADEAPFFHDVYIAKKGPLALDGEESYSAEARERAAALRKQLEALEASPVEEPDMACAVTEGKPVEQKVLIRGDYNSPGEDAPKRFPRVLARPDDPQVHAGSGRLELAQWLTRPDHPLTARVMANRIWAWHFGDGIVRTPDNFGKMGERPTHPELLDWLAARFVESGWSVKAMHRLILLSSAYQMSSRGEGDAENLLLSRFNRRRLDIEEIRDGLLAIDGTLDLTMGGTLQKGFGTDSENSADRLSLDPAKLKRRTVYVPLRRANLPTLLNLFDFGDATTVNGKRALTNVAPQALFMMNSEFVMERARNVAESLPKEHRVEAAYLRILNRAANAEEVEAAEKYVKAFRWGDGWASLCHILMASNDFVYVD